MELEGDMCLVMPTALGDASQVSQRHPFASPEGREKMGRPWCL